MEFRILGALEAWVAGEPVHIGGPRQQKLLALLVLNANQDVPLERLIDEVWGESPPSSVRQQVHNAVTSLRRVVAAPGVDQPIVRTAAGYRLDVHPESIDLRHFLRAVENAEQAESQGQLREAVDFLRVAQGIWRGPALSGLGGQAIEAAAANLEEKRLSAYESEVRLRLQLGETGSLVGELRQLVAEHPLRESLRIGLMQALHRSGRQADALSVYDEGRRILADELGLDPGPRLREAHAAVLAGEDQGQPPDRPAEGRTPVLPANRSYLPHDTRDFSGRSAELGELLAETRNAPATTLVISAIDGMGGVGKTTLAVRLAHLVAGDYPDGQYFVNLHGFTAGVDPVTPDQALDTLLGDSGVPPELIPSGVDRRSALWRSQLAGQRAVLVLDNAVDAAHIRPLLPGAPGVLVVVTSRRKLTALDGAVPMSLDVLPQEDAEALFVKIAGAHRTEAEPAAVATAVALCGHLPLAIRIAAARLRDRSSWSVSDLVDRIRNHAQRVQFLQIDDRNVMAVLRLSYRYMTPQQQRLFRLLSLHPGQDIDAYAAAALCEISVEEAEACLEALFDDNLLKQHSAGRFHFHDLIRDCARQLLQENETDDEQKAATTRLLDYYLYASYTWSRELGTGVYEVVPDAQLRPDQVRKAGSRQQAVEILNEQKDNLVAAALVAAAQGLDRHTWQFAGVLQPLMRLHNYRGRALQLFENGVRAAESCQDPGAESACLHWLGMVLAERGSSAAAMDHFERALKLSRQVGDRQAEIAQLISIGGIHVVEERLEDARSVYLAADALTTSSSPVAVRASIASNLGVILRDLGRLDDALEQFGRARELATQHTSAAPRLLASYGIGITLHRQGRHREAMSEFDHILQGSVAEQFPPGEALALHGLSSARRGLGDLAGALACGRDALARARKLELRELECTALNNISETLIAQNDLVNAEKACEQALVRAEEYGFFRCKARAFEGFAHIAFARGDLVNAERRWRQALTTYPSDLAEARFAEAHLLSLDDRSTTCFRCVKPD
ncbi:BTAD domain-containing putative transcriptional regulator [Lentzea sp. NPDC004782]|uniref:AfsR/SARP family transcriptional regulator n=1 Tax=Lentzea sp. NPDC004782 TaxID=3154458 RepID=UPI0033B2DA0E